MEARSKRTIFWAKLGVYPLKTRPEKLGLILQFRFLKWPFLGGSHVESHGGHPLLFDFVPTKVLVKLPCPAWVAGWFSPT